jgi:hypothetical protein
MLRLIPAILASIFSFLATAEDQVFMKNAPALYNGTKSNPGEFLPMGFIGMCTATAVGPTTIFTAAHCVSNGQRVNFQSRFDQKTYRMICSNHPRYNTRTVFNDYSICRLESGRFPDDMPLASFSFRTPLVGEKLLLNGFGAPTIRVHHWGPETVTRHGGQDIVACGRVFLGGGDSGGSLLAWTEDRSGKSGFEVVGVNSRSDRRSCSYFNRINHSEFQTWSRQYETATGQKLCGVSLDCKEKKPDPEPEPEPEPEPTNCWQVYEELTFCLGVRGIPGCIARAEKLLECVK